MRKRAAVFAGGVVGLAAIVGAAAVPVETGCTTRQCAGGSQDWRNGGWADPGTETKWLTHLSIDDGWISYGGEVQVNIHFPDTGRLPINVVVYTGVTEDGSGSPNIRPAPDSGDMFVPTFAMGVGEEAVMMSWATDQVGVKNATCADYVMYAIVEFDSRFPCPGSTSVTSIEDASCTIDGAPLDPAPATDASTPTDAMTMAAPDAAVAPD